MLTVGVVLLLNPNTDDLIGFLINVGNWQVVIIGIFEGHNF